MFNNPKRKLALRLTVFWKLSAQAEENPDCDSVLEKSHLRETLLHAEHRAQLKIMHKISICSSYNHCIPAQHGQ